MGSTLLRRSVPLFSLIAMAVALLLCPMRARANPPVPMQWSDALGALHTVAPDWPMPVQVTNPQSNLPEYVNLFNSAPLSSIGPVYQMANAVNLQQFTRVTLDFRWSVSQPADTDSVAFGLKVWGRSAEQTGTLHYWSPMVGVPTASDTCFWDGAMSDSTTAAGKCPSTPYSFVIVRNRGVGRALVQNAVAGTTTKVPAASIFGIANTGSSGQLRRISLSVVHWAGPNGIKLSLSDNAGTPFPFKYVWIEVFYLRWCNGQGLAAGNPLATQAIVTCDAWPRVD